MKTRPVSIVAAISSTFESIFIWKNGVIKKPGITGL
jgi:hypothetical protein